MEKIICGPMAKKVCAPLLYEFSNHYLQTSQRISPVQGIVEMTTEHTSEAESIQIQTSVTDTNMSETAA